MTTEAEYLQQYDSSRFPSLLVTVDSVLFTLQEQALCVLLVQRARHPQQGLWALPDSEARLAEGSVLRQAHPGDARVAYEYGSVLDAAGESEQAVPLYEEALATGLTEPYRHRCQVQLGVMTKSPSRMVVRSPSTAV